MGIAWRINSREGIILASGLALGAVVSAALVLAPRWRTPAASPAGSVPAQRVAMAPQARPPCPQEPVAAPNGASDGRFQIQPRLSSYGASDVGAFIAIGKEAAAAARSHDAEVAFIMACRVADQFKGVQSAEAGRARDQLAVHYDDLLRDASPETAAIRSELLRRAELLRPGRAAPAPERPVVTAQAPVQSVQQSPVQPSSVSPVQPQLSRPSPPPAPAPAPAPQAAAQPRAPAVEVAKSRAPAVEVARAPAPAAILRPQVVAQAQVPQPLPRRAEGARPVLTQVPQKVVVASTQRPSFDCAKARSVPEKLICSDAQLAQLDRELGQLHWRAKTSARNSWAFKQRSDEEWRRREATCRDRECLVRWYGQRRYQLMNEIESG